MRITATAGKIAAALALVASAARENKAKPTLGVVRITAEAGEISFAGTDLSIATTASVAAEVHEPGQAAPPHDRLAALVGAYGADAVLTISTTETGVTIGAQGSHASYRLPCLAQDALPDMPAIDTATGEIKMAATDFLRLLEPIAAASTDETRFYLCGVFVQSVGSELVGGASDGARLIRTTVAAETFSEGRDLIIPATAIATLRGLFARVKPKVVTLRRSQRLLAVIAPDFQFVTKLIHAGDTGYPQIDCLIPRPATKPAYCARADLLAVLRRLNAVALTDQVATLATLSAAGGQLSITLTRKPDDGFDHLAVDGDLDKIVISLKQLTGMLDEFDDERVGLEAVSDKAPLVIRTENKFALIARSHWKG